MVMGAEESPQVTEINASSTQGLVIPSRAIHIVKVKSGNSALQLLQEAFWIYQPQAPLDFGVPRIMPVGHLAGVKPVQELRKAFVQRQLQNSLAVFNRQTRGTPPDFGKKGPNSRLDAIESRNGPFPHAIHGPVSASTVASPDHILDLFR